MIFINKTLTLSDGLDLFNTLKFFSLLDILDKIYIYIYVYIFNSCVFNH